MGKPKMTDVSLLIQAGMDPKTGLPLKIAPSAQADSPLRRDMKRALQVMDKEEATARYVWYNLPKGLSSELMEKVLYYRGQGMFFYLEGLDRFFFLPYALAGSIDVYGRYVKTTPVPFAGGTTNSKGEVEPWIPGKVYECEYEVVMPDELTIEKFNGSCVLIHDYPTGESQTTLARKTLNDPILDTMSECIPLMRTALINNCGVQGIKVNSGDEQLNIQLANQQVQNSAMNGSKWVALTQNLDIQELTGTSGMMDTEKYMIALQSLDNLRLSLYGLENGGIYRKEGRMLQSEQALNSGVGSIGLISQSGLTERQNACNIINSIWGLGIWCEMSEIVSNYDRDMNGEISDTQTPTPTANPTNQEVNENDNE